MRIVFTNHAKQRCKERKISDKWVTARLLKIPLSTGTNEHLIDGTSLTVVYNDRGNIRTVITLYSVILEREEVQKKPVNLAPLRDLLDKEKQKFKRRKKKSNYSKFRK